MLGVVKRGSDDVAIRSQPRSFPVSAPIDIHRTTRLLSRCSQSVPIVQRQMPVALRRSLLGFVRKNVDTSGASGLAPGARIEAGLTFSSSSQLSSSPRLSPPFETHKDRYAHTARPRRSSGASNVFGPTLRKRLSRFSDVATDVSGVLPLICRPPSSRRWTSSLACMARFASRNT